MELNCCSIQRFQKKVNADVTPTLDLCPTHPSKPKSGLRGIYTCEGVKTLFVVRQ